MQYLLSVPNPVQKGTHITAETGMRYTGLHEDGCEVWPEMSIMLLQKISTQRRT